MSAHPAAPAPATVEQDDVPERVATRPSMMHRAEYAALRGAIAAFKGIGFAAASTVGARMGSLGYRPFAIRRDVVRRHVAAAFPELSQAEVTRIARASYEHLGRMSIETALLPTFDRSRILELFEEVEGWSIVEERLARGKGLIMVTGHLGNWEVGGAYIAARGVPLEVVARHMANPLFDAYLTRTRERIGMRVVHDEDAVRRVPRHLRRGGGVAFLVDQGVLGLASTWVPFFGRMAKTPRGPAVFALRLGTPIVFGVAIRRPNGRFCLSFEPVEARSTGDRDADVDRIVADYTSILEKWVRAAPEQYFWHHRRWKHQRPGTPPELGEP
jgi:Kdo2-lipid IVA lauroyltransferase/acyltransferase